MNDDMVMRSVYLRPSQDGHLRQLAHEHHVSKSDLIRSAISAKLEEWVADPSNKLILKDLELGRRTPAAGRIDPEPVAPVVRVSAVQPKKKKAVAAPKARPERPATGRAVRPAAPKTTGEPRRVTQGALEMAD